MDIKEIRLLNLLTLAQKHGQDIDFCKRIDMNPSYLPQLKSRGKSIGDKIARKVEEKLGLQRGFMDVSHESAELPDKLPDSDVMATAYSIESLPKPLRDQFKRLVFQMVAYCNEGTAPAIDTASDDDIHPFDMTVERKREDGSSEISHIQVK